MALANIAKFNWDKLLNKVDDAAVKRSINLLRAKSNELTASADKFGKTAAPIDFAAYRSKLRFSAAAIDSLEAAYKNKNLPVYTASIPPLEAKKRELTLAVINDISAATEADLVLMRQQLEDFEKLRITKDTTVLDLQERFPEMAREIEKELKAHQWALSNQAE